jgi:hypothetical protein
MANRQVVVKREVLASRPLRGLAPVLERLRYSLWNQAA